MNRLTKALLAYAIIAALAWFTLGDDKIKLAGGYIEASPRQFVLALMAILAVLSLLNHWREQAREKLRESGRDE
jgi:ABC-type uncharacterized transport system involved in gliding motility auxiliary subunit